MATLITTFGSISTAAIVISCVAYGVGVLIVPFLGPETRGRALPDDGPAVGPATASAVGAGTALPTPT